MSTTSITREMSRQELSTELCAQFAKEHAALHRDWTAAVGKPGYVKAHWRDRDDELVRRYRDAARAIGYDGPLLGYRSSAD